MKLSRSTKRLYINKDKLSPYNNPAGPKFLKNSFTQGLLHTLKMFIIILPLHIGLPWMRHSYPSFSLTEQFKVDNLKVISLVSMDLSKAFDTLPHNLIVKKLEDYGRDSKVINLVTNYLSDRQQRVRLSGQYSSMKTIMKGVFQGSILGSILFNIFMNDLSYAIDESKLFTYADDTQLLKSAENVDQVEHAINADLKKVDVWYEFNQTREIIQNIKQLLLEGSREILC